MATATSKLGLTKPSYTDAADVGVLNNNFDILDREVSKRTRVWNLLDNSDFLHPVNQRGQTSHTGHGYFIDRWFSQIDNIQTEITSEGISTTWNLTQLVLQDPTKVYTVAVCMADGSIWCTSGIPANGEFGEWNKVWCSNWNNIGIFFCIHNTTGQAQTYRWAALYEGEYTAETLPPYVPKGYAAELAECQRYHIIPGLQPVQGWCYDWGRLEVHIPLPVAMRLPSPTVTFNSGAEWFWIGTTIYPCTYQGCTVIPNGIILYFTHNAGVFGAAIIPDLSVNINCDL